MNSDLTAKLALIRAECQRDAEATGESLFREWSGNSYEWDALSDIETQRWNRLAIKQRKAARAVLGMMDALERTAKWNLEVGWQAKAALQLIADEWPI